MQVHRTRNLIGMPGSRASSETGSENEGKVSKNTTTFDGEKRKKGKPEGWGAKASTKRGAVHFKSRIGRRCANVKMHLSAKREQERKEEFPNLRDARDHFGWVARRV